jgi:hypothetical protein
MTGPLCREVFVAGQHDIGLPNRDADSESLPRLPTLRDGGGPPGDLDPAM